MNNRKSKSVYEDWNPWHGCTKISPGCKYLGDYEICKKHYVKSKCK